MTKEYECFIQPLSKDIYTSFPSRCTVSSVRLFDLLLPNVFDTVVNLTLSTEFSCGDEAFLSQKITLIKVTQNLFISSNQHIEQTAPENKAFDNA